MNRRELIQSGLAALASVPFMGWVGKAMGHQVGPAEAAKSVAKYVIRCPGVGHSLACVVTEYQDGTLCAEHGHMNNLAGFTEMQSTEVQGWLWFIGRDQSVMLCRLKPRSEGGVLEVRKVHLRQYLGHYPESVCGGAAQYLIYHDTFQSTPQPRRRALRHGN